MLAINLPLQEYERNSTTKFSCYSSDKGFRKIGKFNIWKGGRGIIFQKKKQSLRRFSKLVALKIWENYEVVNKAIDLFW